MRATQQLKSGFFLGSTGQITLPVDPPTTLALAVGGGSLPPIDITGLLNLEFLKGKPVLPQSYTFSAKLESQTWSQPVPMQQLPHIQEAKNCHSVSERCVLRRLDVDRLHSQLASGTRRLLPPTNPSATHCFNPDQKGL
ncbi:hypothetical protein FPSE5266_20256 [Fusarium pseudograminearum]|nr:hypothetical protein FPSE5266_20256 [Fusarium pseudograminearum]